MKRTLCIVLFIVATASAAGIIYIRHSPWAINRFAPTAKLHGRLPKRTKKYYDASLVANVDSIVVVKQLREMYVFRQKKLQKIYRVALGDAPIGHKHFEGDEKTPEGLYTINGKNPNSSCHKNLGISYPNDADCAYAGLHHKPTGGDIKIHGIVNGQGHVGKAHLLHDWTNGCVAITDEEVDELYKYTTTGIPILILP